jgi:hypothetical protein
MTQKSTVRVPDGAGGWVEAEGTVHPGSAVDTAKQAAAITRAFIDEAGTLTERLLQYDAMYLREMGLTKEHRAFAAALYCVNLRETYPDGPEAFDAVAASAAAYYDENAPKVRR